MTFTGEGALRMRDRRKDPCPADASPQRPTITFPFDFITLSQGPAGLALPEMNPGARASRRPCPASERSRCMKNPAKKDSSLRRHCGAFH